MAQKILERRAIYPINDTPATIVSPPGWHPPKDWASYPRPIAQLQDKAATSMASDSKAEPRLDYMYGDGGRIIYNCEPTRLPFIGGVCLD